MAAAQQGRALALGNLHIALRSFNLGGVHLRAHLDGLVKPIADLQLSGPFHQFFGELGGDAFLQQDAAGGCAALAGGAEGAPQRSFERQFEVGVVEHDLRVFAAHLQRNRLEGGRGALRHMRADGA